VSAASDGDSDVLSAEWWTVDSLCCPGLMIAVWRVSESDYCDGFSGVQSHTA